jgi:hypothetical protein
MDATIPAFLNLKKICSRKTEEISSSSERHFMETGSPSLSSFANAREARKA